MKSTMQMGIGLLVAALALVAAPAVARAQTKTTEIKVATLAPKGSAWAKILDDAMDGAAERMAPLDDAQLRTPARWSGYAVDVGFRLGRMS